MKTLTSSKRWLLATPASAEHLTTYRDMSAVLAQVLYNRGFESSSDAFQFLQANQSPFNPFELKGMNQAVARIRNAIRKSEPIIIYGDFDADGVTATALLVTALHALGANVKPYIPHRIDEGYGLNSAALSKLARAGVRLVITVDCGIRSVQEVADGRSYGLDMIVTDHHSVGVDIPPANAVINPKQIDCKYPEDMLAGVGIAYKLADALFRATASDRYSKQPEIQLESLLDLVAIGTVADLAPLDRLENRVLVQRGLDVINNGTRAGIRALIEVAAARHGAIDAGRIGYALGPRINAAGRLDSAMTAYHLLMAQDMPHAERLAIELQSLNTRRQELTRLAQDMIRERLESGGETDAPLIFAQDASFQPGIVGLVAGRLSEEYYRPAVVMELGEEESRASCRSIPQFDITQALDQCADLLVRHGGHAQAAGLTVRNENIPTLRARLTEIAATQLSGQELTPTIDIDMELPYKLIDLPLAEELTRLEPTGHHNRPPIFMSRRLRVVERRAVGKDNQHLRLRLSHPGQPTVDAIGFGLGDRLSDLPEMVDVAYELTVNEWNGSRTAQLSLQDVRGAE
ncbi:MAG: single-stranded-DNA-specific exonuclease RecJ [Anaerolineae bacterium]|nr:single-stranded-DNA-specific exonuclease RecJ [Anaerolineae bacterium]